MQNFVAIFIMIIFLIYIIGFAIGKEIIRHELKFGGWFIEVILVLIFTAFFYIAIPNIFKGNLNEILVFTASSLTIFNVMGVFLSWKYFNDTHCWDDELNSLARKAYMFIGEDLVHLIIFVIRLAINIYIIYRIRNGTFIINLPIPFSYEFFMICILTSIFLSETIMNTYAIFYGETKICLGKNKMCKDYGIFCDQAMNLKEDL